MEGSQPKFMTLQDCILKLFRAGKTDSPEWKALLSYYGNKKIVAIIEKAQRVGDGITPENSDSSGSENSSSNSAPCS